MPRPETLRAALADAPEGVWLGGASAHAPWCEIVRVTRLDRDVFAGRSVLLRTSDQFSAALALIDLDGVAARIVIAPPDLRDDQIPAIVASAGIEAIVGERDLGEPRALTPLPRLSTEWVLFTSGTTGAPKMAVHDLETLTGAIQDARTPGLVWGTFYDIRRYGGLQIFLRAALGHASMVLSEADEAVGDFLARLAPVTHLTGTPSHWRRALMSPALAAISPRYVRLSGEIADQAILDNLGRAFPGAALGHAYASTEAGVGFEVTDGRAGFPAALLERAGPVEMKVTEGTLRIRSPRAARYFIGMDAPIDADGFLDTGDMIEQRGERLYFMGRQGGIINFGGAKIHPEEVEAVINRQPGVRVSRVRARRSPITGAFVVADVVLDAGIDPEAAREAILSACRAELKPFQQPAMIEFVGSLELTAGGKLARVPA